MGFRNRWVGSSMRALVCLGFPLVASVALFVFYAVAVIALECFGWHGFIMVARAFKLSPP